MLIIGLLRIGLVVKNDDSLGWIINERVNHVMSIV